MAKKKNRMALRHIMLKRAKAMRWYKATKHEIIARQILWDICKAEKLVVRNQRVFYNKSTKKWYIVDFWLPDIKLVIEIDGASHAKQKEYDRIRTIFLNSQGNEVIRFKNEETRQDNFKERLYSAIKSRQQSYKPIINQSPKVINIKDNEYVKRMAYLSLLEKQSKEKHRLEARQIIQRY